MHDMESHCTDINNLDIKAKINNIKIIWKCVPVITSMFQCVPVFLWGSCIRRDCMQKDWTKKRNQSLIFQEKPLSFMGSYKFW